MASRVPDGWRWRDAPVWRAHMLARDLRRLARGLARIVRTALREPACRPGVSVLEGAALAAPTGAAYRIRFHNPCAEVRTLDVVLRGRRDDDARAGFELRWSETLPPGAARDRWVTTDWRGHAALADAPQPAALVLPTAGPHATWSVEAQATTHDAPRPPKRLRIAGSLVA